MFAIVIKLIWLKNLVGLEILLVDSIAWFRPAGICVGACLNRIQVGVVIINARTDVSKYSLCYLLSRRSDIFLVGVNAVSYDRAITLYSDQ